MSIWTWAAVVVYLAVVTVYFIVTQTPEDIERRKAWGGEREEMGLVEAVKILVRAALAPVVAWHRHKPERKHSTSYLGKSAVRVTTLQTVCGR